MNQIVKQIERIMLHFFNGNKEAYEKWYNKPHIFFDGRYGANSSPKQMIESGRAKEVLKFITELKDIIT